MFRDIGFTTIAWNENIQHNCLTVTEKLKRSPRSNARHGMVLTRKSGQPIAPRGHLQYLLYLLRKGALEKKRGLSAGFSLTKESHSGFKHY